MPVRHGLLALLADGPAHGYQLKADFEQRTGGAWQLNIGQVYTTLRRLERDGLIEAAGDGDEDRRAYALTPAGRYELAQWYGTPIAHDPPPRDELAIKVLLALDAPGVDAGEVIQRQRTITVEHLQRLTRRKRELDDSAALGPLLELDAQILRADAAARWLDICEERLRSRPALAGVGVRRAAIDTPDGRAPGGVPDGRALDGLPDDTKASR